MPKKEKDIGSSLQLLSWGFEREFPIIWSADLGGREKHLTFYISFNCIYLFSIFFYFTLSFGTVEVVK